VFVLLTVEKNSTSMQGLFKAPKVAAEQPAADSNGSVIMKEFSKNGALVAVTALESNA